MALSSSHVASLKDDEYHDPGCVFKCVPSKRAFSDKGHGAYRRNGFQEIRGNQKKRATYEFAGIKHRIAIFGPPEPEKASGTGQLRTPNNPATDQGSWDFVGENFQKGYQPYNHDYHHMMPWDTLKQALSSTQARMLMKAKYNLNAGINLIILPKSSKIGKILGLFSHPNNHPGYNESLAGMLDELCDMLSSDPAECNIEDQDLTAVKNRLEAWEKREFFEIVRAGNSARGAHVDTHKPSPLLSGSRQ